MIFTKAISVWQILQDEQEGLSMSRIRKETLSPMYLHETYGVYQGVWIL